MRWSAQPKAVRGWVIGDRLQEDDRIDFTDLTLFAPGKPLNLVFKHQDGSRGTILCNHTYNAQQIEWFKAGSALNIIRAQQKG